MAKNHYWKVFENACARAFGGVGRFPANQGGALDFETPWAIGQCKTMKTSAKRASYTTSDVAKWCGETLAIARRGKDRAGKWPVVCVKVRRGVAVRSQTLICLTWKAAVEWMGQNQKMFAEYSVKDSGRSLDELTTFVEDLLKTEPSTLGVRVIEGRAVFVAVAWDRFFQNHTFKKARAKKAA